LFMAGDYDFTTKNNMHFAALTEILRIKLMERLRQQESGIYSVNVNVQRTNVPAQRYTFAINFTCAPEHVDLLIADALDEVNKIKANGPEDVDIEKYKSAYSRNVETQLKSNTFWLTFITAQYENQFDLNEILDKTMSDDVTKTSLKEFANRYLSGNNFAQVVLLPESFKNDKTTIRQ